ncbi:MAG: hypothetical protein CL608_22225 [Anaerolineaceae bacterium]|nr:hypothetical protein [Anaerolineaceae bacterium]
MNVLWNLILLTGLFFIGLGIVGLFKPNSFSRNEIGLSHVGIRVVGAIFILPGIEFLLNSLNNLFQLGWIDTQYKGSVFSIFLLCAAYGLMIFVGRPFHSDSLSVYSKSQRLTATILYFILGIMGFFNFADRFLEVPQLINDFLLFAWPFLSIFALWYTVRARNQHQQLSKN